MSKRRGNGKGTGFLYRIMKHLVSKAGIAGVLFFVASTSIGGFQFDSYSHLTQFISETYATGTPWGIRLRWFGFVPAGLLLAVFGFAMARKHWANKPLRLGLLGLAVWYGLGTVVASFAPCDFGCDPEQASPSMAHVIHFLVGGLTYLLTPPSMLLVAYGASLEAHMRTLWPFLATTGMLMLVGAVLLFAGMPEGAMGLVQRITEGAALTTIVAIAVLFNRP